ncbi:MAG: rhodanese-like domain-containing protein [Desulfuromusa sp.]|nr:rhodanese-like domain-containing protein [Desulfuromusa sp.]
MTTQSAGLAKKLGYTNVKAFLGGDPAWTAEGHPLYASSDYVKNGNILLLDLRESDTVIEGRISRSVNIPYDDLENHIFDLPLNAPTVIYSDNSEDVSAALYDLREEGIKAVSMVVGNYQGWVFAGEKTESGPDYLTEVNWVRQYGKDEVRLGDFKKAVLGELTDTFVLDVRNVEEVQELGIFKNTVNIPLDEIPKRLAEIPKDKRIFIHCSTGARAELASRELKKNGFDAKYLLLKITDPECDCPVIK